MFADICVHVYMQKHTGITKSLRVKTINSIKTNSHTYLHALIHTTHIPTPIITAQF